MKFCKTIIFAWNVYLSSQMHQYDQSIGSLEILKNFVFEKTARHVADQEGSCHN